MWGASPLTARRMDPRALREVLTQLTTPMPTWWRRPGDVTAETLVVAGGRRSHLSQPRFSLLTQALPHAHLVTIEAGHRVDSRRPDEFAAALPATLGPQG